KAPAAAAATSVCGRTWGGTAVATDKSFAVSGTAGIRFGHGRYGPTPRRAASSRAWVAGPGSTGRAGTGLAQQRLSLQRIRKTASRWSRAGIAPLPPCSSSYMTTVVIYGGATIMKEIQLKDAKA